MDFPETFAVTFSHLFTQQPAMLLYEIAWKIVKFLPLCQYF